MKRFHHITILFLLISLLLCGCTKQRNIDTAEFCKRFNTLSGTEILQPDAFFREAAESAREYNCNFPFSEGQTALLTLTTDQNGTVTAFQLTCVASDVQNTPESFGALYQTYIKLVTVLTVCESADDAEILVQSAGILPEQIGFSDFGFVGEEGGHRFSVFSGEMYLSMFCERV